MSDIPAAWVRMVHSYIPGEPTEIEADMVYGDDAPDGDSWVPLYYHSDYAALLSLSAEKDKTIADLDALVQSLQNRWAARPLSSVDAEHLERENIEKDKRIEDYKVARDNAVDMMDEAMEGARNESCKLDVALKRIATLEVDVSNLRADVITVLDQREAALARIAVLTEVLSSMKAAFTVSGEQMTTAQRDALRAARAALSHVAPTGNQVKGAE